MKHFVRLSLLLFLLILPLAACSSSGKTRKPKKKTTMINTTQLGKNKYFFSAKYQRKLSRSRKKRR
ncbi:MAG: hypothetical protein GXO83_00285 [Chlorobi bacterium]|nr:hypothetical protein [Chlorobiota bacterium]